MKHKKTLFDKIKSDYLKVQPTLRLKKSGWDDVFNKISNTRDRFYLDIPKRWIFSITTFVFVFVFLFGLVANVKAALPGSHLYPLKILMEKVIKNVTGKNDIILNHRTQEVISLIQNNSGGKSTYILPTAIEAAQRYAKAVDDLREETKDNQQKSVELEKKIEESHSKLRDVVRIIPEVEDQIKNVLKSPDAVNNDPVNDTEDNDNKSRLENNGQFTEVVPSDTHLKIEINKDEINVGL